MRRFGTRQGCTIQPSIRGSASTALAPGQKDELCECVCGCQGTVTIKYGWVNCWQMENDSSAILGRWRDVQMPEITPNDSQNASGRIWGFSFGWAISNVLCFSASTGFTLDVMLKRMMMVNYKDWSFTFCSKIGTFSERCSRCYKMRWKQMHSPSSPN